MDESRARLGGGDNPTLMPAHYLHVTLPKIGGAGLTVQIDGQTCGYGFFFPRTMDGETPVYTLRYHRLPHAPTVDPDELAQRTANLLDPASRVRFYDPLAPKNYTPTHQKIGDLDFGRPDVGEAQTVRTIQQMVWNNPPEVLYPVDIHSAEFALATSLVARSEGEVAAFLFGMTKFDGTRLPGLWQERLHHRVRLESQAMAVRPVYRGKHIAFLLKKVQAEDALAQGMHIINWTADPLQFPNAALNFSRLGAVAYEAYPALYAFHNELNQVAASRFSLTWLVGSRRVQQILSGSQHTSVVDLTTRPDIVRVNDGADTARFDVDAATIAFAIPADWTGLQKNDLPQALRWREITDGLFLHYLGREAGRYMITGAGVDRECRYLLAQRVDEELLENLCPKVRLPETTA